MINHKIIRPILALAVGVILAFYVYQWVTDPAPGIQRAREEAVVMSAREILQSYIAPGEYLEVVDPLAPNRKIGKVYIYPAGDGWEVSGLYRRSEDDPWHPYLMSLDAQARLMSLAVRDANDRLLGMSAQDSKFSAVPPGAID